MDLVVVEELIMNVEEQVIPLPLVHLKEIMVEMVLVQEHLPLNQEAVVVAHPQ